MTSFPNVMTPSSTPMPARQMPNTDSVSSLPKKDRRSASSLAKYIEDQYQDGLKRRAPHATKWLRVKSVMRDCHYFKIRNGVWMPLKKKKGQIRAVRKIMRPRYRWELGRLNSNRIGVHVHAKPGEGEKTFYHAERGQAVLDNWSDEQKIQSKTYGVGNQMLLFYGLMGYYRYIDSFHKTVRVKAVPGPEYFPIPSHAPSLEEADGLMRVQIVSKEWLETQDAVQAQTNGQVNQGKPKPMAMKAATLNTRLSLGYPGIGGPDSFGGTLEGALVKTVWMKPTQLNPQGLWMFFVDDELFRFKGEEDENGPVLLNGKIPHELVYYQQHPDDFWGVSFLEDLFSDQIEANRQMTDLIVNARRNRGVTVIDSSAIDIKDIQSERDMIIPARSGSFDQRPPIYHHPPAQLSRDVGVILALVEQGADKSVGYESQIILGRQEGRTEGGPATSMLNANAQMPLQPVIDGLYEAWAATFPEVLDMLRTVWPKEKLVRSAMGLGREMLIRRDEVPSSQQVLITPFPIVPGGRNTMLQLLFQLRQMPADDGKGFEIKSRELRRSLQLMGVTPPGLQLIDKREQRINDRIALVINDGVKPSVGPAVDQPELKFEDHALAIELLKERILDPSFKFFKAAVQTALLEELEFHARLIAGGFAHPSAFDDDVEDEDARLQERTLLAEETNLADFSGDVVLDGEPVVA